MNQVSCRCDPNLDQPNHSNAKQTVIDTFSFKDISEYDIALIFVSDEFLSDLKKEYFQKNHFTDVISFRLNEYDKSFVEGEVYISLPRAKENSKIFNEPYTKEVSRLIIHGCLHLIGFKDESKSEKEIMTKSEEEILKITNWEGLFTDL
tara:strand:- start:14 stop:460 length:447 start_codon:yes stop_codon:yes gene_type:complete